MLISLAFGVVLVLGRNWLADRFESFTGWGPSYRRSCVWLCAIGGTLQVIAVTARVIELLL
jgi:hypothetical protein